MMMIMRRRTCCCLSWRLVLVALAVVGQQQQQQVFVSAQQQTNEETNESKEASRSSSSSSLSSLSQTPRPSTATAVRAEASARVLPNFNVYEDDDMSLAKRLASFAGTTQEDHHFETLLRAQQQQQQQAKQEDDDDSRLQQSSTSTTSTTTAKSISSFSSSSSSSWYWLGGIVLVFGAATLASPATVWPEIQTTAAKVLSLQVIGQVLSYLGTSPGLRYINLLWLAHLLGQQAQQPGVMDTLRQHVWPVVKSTTHKLVVAELWSVLWKYIEEPWDFLWHGGSCGGGATKHDKNSASAVVESRDDHDNHPDSNNNNNNNNTHFAWLYDAYHAAVKIIHKGGPKLVKALLRKHIDDFIASLLSRGVTIIKDAAATFAR